METAYKRLDYSIKLFLYLDFDSGISTSTSIFFGKFRYLLAIKIVTS